MSLTKEQMDLLKTIVGVYHSGCRSSFIVSELQEGTSLIYDTHPSVSIEDVMDLRRLAKHDLVDLVERPGRMSGKPTAKGIEMVAVGERLNIPSGQLWNEPPQPPHFQSEPPKPIKQSDPAMKILSSHPAAQLKKQVTISITPAQVVFIGHGRSREWLALKDYIANELEVKCVEFNSESAAGISTKERLEDMLNEATFAFLVMTAEEQQADGSLRARQNVIHEVGLFQGRLGFDRAIVLLEEGCKDFSNISGVTHIPFQPNKIESSFHEVWKVLKKRKVIAG